MMVSKELEKKALQIAVGEDGGWRRSDTLDQIMQMERDEVTMRTLCNVIQFSNENYKKLVNLGYAGSGWVRVRAKIDQVKPTAQN